MASKPGPLSEWPWQDWGDWKYLLYAPFALAVATGHDDDDSWCRHMCQITLLRYAIAQFFISLSRIHAVTSKTRIQKNGISYQQIDREDHWDDYMLLQAYVATAVHFLPYLGYNHFQLYSSTSLWWMLAFHAGPAEFLYYWLHRALHHHVLYAAYHSHHHQCEYYYVHCVHCVLDWTGLDCTGLDCIIVFVLWRAYVCAVELSIYIIYVLTHCHSFTPINYFICLTNYFICLTSTSSTAHDTHTHI